MTFGCAAYQIDGDLPYLTVCTAAAFCIAVGYSLKVTMFPISDPVGRGLLMGRKVAVLNTSPRLR